MRNKVSALYCSRLHYPDTRRRSHGNGVQQHHEVQLEVRGDKCQAHHTSYVGYSGEELGVAGVGYRSETCCGCEHVCDMMVSQVYATDGVDAPRGRQQSAAACSSACRHDGASASSWLRNTEEEEQHEGEQPEQRQELPPQLQHQRRARHAAPSHTEQAAATSTLPFTFTAHTETGAYRQTAGRRGDSTLVFSEESRERLEAIVGGWYWVKPPRGDG